MASYLRPRRGTKEVAEEQAIVLKKGEVFFEYPATGPGTGGGKIKMGDGLTTYANLPYYSSTDLNDDTATVSFTNSTTPDSNTSTHITSFAPSASLKVLFTHLKQLLLNFNSDITKAAGVELTQAQYDALTPAQQASGTYWITDGSGGGGGSMDYTLFADEFDTATTYSSGDTCVYNNTWYIFTADKAAGAWDSTKVSAYQVNNIIQNTGFYIGPYTISSGETTYTINNAFLKTTSILEIFYDDDSVDEVTNAGVTYDLSVNGTLDITFDTALTQNVTISAIHVTNL